MNEKQIFSLLYTIYLAGFNHGSNEGPMPEHAPFESFQRLIVGESPTEDSMRYDIKEKVEKLMALGQVKKRKKRCPLFKFKLKFFSSN